MEERKLLTVLALCATYVVMILRENLSVSSILYIPFSECLSPCS